MEIAFKTSSRLKYELDEPPGDQIDILFVTLFANAKNNVSKIK